MHTQYVYIYIYVYMYMQYIYIYIERERDSMDFLGHQGGGRAKRRIEVIDARAKDWG